MTNEAIAARLRQLREAFGYTQQNKFAERCNISQTAYNNFERGTRRMSLDEAMKIRRATGVTLDWIYDGDSRGLPLQIAEKLNAASVQAERQSSS